MSYEEYPPEMDRRKDKSPQLLQSIQAAVVVHGPDTKILNSNRASQELLGLTKDQVHGRKAIDPAWKFFNEDGTDMVLADYPVNQVLSTKQPLRDFIIGIHRQNKNDVIWALVDAEPQFDADGNISQVIVTFMDITYRREAAVEREKLLADLQDAIKEIKTLRSILPICLFCKKVRDDKGYWESVDKYIKRNLHADVSHGICPDCFKEHYPDIVIE